MLNIHDYGAVGDGVTDCRAAFETAIIDSTASTEAVFIPDGEYFISAGAPIESSVIDLVGESRDNTRIIAAQEWLFRCTTQGLIRDLTIHGAGIFIPGSEYAQAFQMTRVNIFLAPLVGFWVEAGGITNTGYCRVDLTDCAISDCYQHSLTFFGEGQKDLYLKNCTFKNSGWSHLLYISPHHNFVIEGCEFDGAAKFAIQLQGGIATILPKFQIIRDCMFFSENHNGVVTDGSGTVEILGCTFLCEGAIFARSGLRMVGCYAESSEQNISMISVSGGSVYDVLIRDCRFVQKAGVFFRPIMELRRSNPGRTTIDSTEFVVHGNGNGMVAVNGFLDCDRVSCRSIGRNIGIDSECDFARITRCTFQGDWTGDKGCVILRKSGQVMQVSQNLWMDSNYGPIFKAEADAIVLHGQNSTYNSNTPVVSDDELVSWQIL